MKPLLFKVPTIDDRSFRIEQDRMPHFYGHLHFHPEIQLTYIQEGEGTLIVGDRIDRFGQHDVLLLGANLPHVFRSDPDYFLPESTRLSASISVLFRPENLVTTALNLPETRHLLEILREAQHGLRLRCQEGHSLAALFVGLPLQRPLEQLLTLLTMLELLATSSTKETLSVTAFERPQRPEDHQRLERIFAFMLEQYHQPITLDEVASIANLTPGAFCRFFRQHTRKTFSTLLNEIRVEHACRCLRESQQSIGQIAYLCGFTNLSNFNRQFKTIMGVSPSAYIRQYARVAE